MNIRPAHSGDIKAIMRMAESFYSSMALANRLAEYDADEMGIWIWSCIESADKVCFIAEDEDGAAGFMTGLVAPAFWNRRVIAALETILWVEPEKQRSGLGREILSVFTDWAVNQHGASTVSSGYAIDNEPECGGVFSGFRPSEMIVTKEV